MDQIAFTIDFVHPRLYKTISVKPLCFSAFTENLRLVNPRINYPVKTNFT